MKRTIFKLVFLCILAIVSLELPLAPEIQDLSQKRFKNIIIKFRNNINQWDKISLESAYGLKEIKYSPLIGAYLYEPIQKQSAILYSVQQNPLVEYAEPDYEIKIASRFPNDPYFAKQWGLHNIGQTGGIPDIDMEAPEAWGVSTGGKEIVVAIIDTGIDYHHEDLQKNIWINSDEAEHNGIDDDHNGYIDDYYGINAISGTGDPSDDNGHGTHNAGIIGAVGNNGIGISGVCWDVQLMALKCLNQQGEGCISDAIECIQYALNKNVQIINCPWGIYNRSIALEKAIEAGKERGAIFVVPAGNSGLDIDIYPFFPASYDCENIISVGAIDKTGNRAIFSNYGDKSVDIFAPGKDIFSTLPYHRYDLDSGTSMSSAYVAGSAALIRSFNSNLNYTEIREILIESRESSKGQILKNSAVNLINSFNCLNSQSKFLLSKSSKFNTNKNQSLSESVLDGNRGQDYSNIQGQNTLSQNNKQVKTLHGGDAHSFIAEQTIELIVGRIPSSGGAQVLGKDEFGNDYENDFSRYWWSDPDQHSGIKNGTILEDEIWGAEIHPTVHHFWKPWSDWNDGLQEDEYTGYHFDSALKKAVVAKVLEFTDWSTKSLWDSAIELYEMGNKDQAFFYLGRVIHLLSDMSLPAHTLNDNHCTLSFFDSGDDKYEEFIKYFYPIYANMNYDLSKETAIRADDLEFPYTWDSFPPEIKEEGEPYSKTKVSKIFYSMAKKACKFESDERDGYGLWGGTQKSDHLNEDPPWYVQYDNDHNQLDLTPIRCNKIGDELMRPVIRHVESLLRVFIERVDPIPPISTLKINGLDVVDGQEYKFISGPITIEFNAQDTGPAGLDRINWKLGNDVWKSSSNGESYVVNDFGSYELKFYSIDKLGNIEKNIGGEIKHIDIVIGKSESTFTGYLDSNNTSVSHTITLPADGELKLKIAYDLTLSVNSLSIYDQNNSILFSQYNPTNGATYGPYGLKAGTYSLKVTRSSGSGSYTLTTTYNAQTIPNDLEPNDTPSTAVPAPNNGNVTGHLGYTGGGNGTIDTTDYYEITLNTDGETKLKIDCDPALSIYFLRIRDINNSVLFSQYNPTSGVTYGPYGLKAGTYFIEIVRNTGFGGYTVTTTYNAQTIPNDLEPNDTPSTAVPAPNNGSVTGHLGYTGGGEGTIDTTDYYKISLSADGKTKLKVDHDPTLSIYFLRIRDINNSVLFSQYNPTSGVTYGPYGLKSGEYFIEVVRNTGYGGYTLATSYNAQTIPNDPEPNDTPSTAVPAPNNGSVTGHLGYTGGGEGTVDTTDYYRITLNTDGEIKLKIDFDSSLSIYFLRIRDINNSVLFSQYNPTSGVTYGPYGLKAGTYFIEIVRNTGFGGYTLQIQTFAVMPLTVTTTPVSNITTTTTQSGGNVISDGGATVTERGVCWSTSANPTTLNPHTYDGTGAGSFTSNITGLTPRTNYHVRAYATNASGTAYGSDVAFITAGLKNDFNRDGKVDILWRYNGPGGYNCVWFMNGTAVLGGVNLPPVADSNWQIGGTGDFNGDGNVDILWRYYGPGGYNCVWFTDGTTITGGANLPAVSDLNWQIGGTGDFNGDGNLDILWRYYGPGGNNCVWFLNGTSVTGGANLPAVDDSSWTIAGTGDFNGDTKVDILWRYIGTGGSNCVWFMNGTTITGGANLPAISDLNWRIAGTGDFNGDTKVDIIWRYYGPGGYSCVWFMNGTTITGGADLPAISDLNWRIVNH